MTISSIYPNYIQKSRLFLYPILGIKRGTSVTPKETYMSWDNVYTLDDNKLIIVYHLREDLEFKNFEENIQNNKYFETFFELEDNTGAFVFDLSKHKSEFQKIVKGKYSQVDDDYKNKIIYFFKNHKKHHSYIMSYLYPVRYFNMYGTVLGVPTSLLKEVGELCSLPDLKKEKLIISQKVLNLQSI
tara:strand:- start:10721 stop:11278 length:558 start_codon:yes stop_codon:yes gene_type:complete